MRNNTRTRSTTGVEPRAARLTTWVGLVALLALPACGQSGSPVAPEPRPGGGASSALAADEVSEFSPEGLVAFLVPPDLTQPRRAGSLVSAARGGSVELNGFRVDIPARALARDTYVTVDLPATLPDAQYVVVEFGPAGTRFRKPVTITLPLGGTDVLRDELPSVSVWYWTGSQWEDYGGSASQTSVSTRTDHFSTYGARRGGIDTTSGG